ncbi:SANT domain-containing protein [Plasmodiophora brassicae]
MQTVSGRILKLGHSFKIPKLIRRFNGEKLVEALFTRCNEFDEPIVEMLTFGASLAELLPALRGFMKRILLKSETKSDGSGKPLNRIRFMKPRNAGNSSARLAPNVSISTIGSSNSLQRVNRASTSFSPLKRRINFGILKEWPSFKIRPLTVCMRSP